MKLSAKTVLHTAKLAKLPLEKKEIKTLTLQLSEIVTYFDQLNEVDTTDIEATSQTTGLENVFREDKPDTNNCLAQTDALSGTDNAHNGFVVVPMVLENKDK